MNILDVVDIIIWPATIFACFFMAGRVAFIVANRAINKWSPKQ